MEQNQTEQLLRQPIAPKLTQNLEHANGKLFPHLLFRAVLAVRLDLNDPFS